MSGSGAVRGARTRATVQGRYLLFYPVQGDGRFGLGNHQPGPHLVVALGREQERPTARGAKRLCNKRCICVCVLCVGVLCVSHLHTHDVDNTDNTDKTSFSISGCGFDSR
jgi:hypothetical protein